MKRKLPQEKRSGQTLIFMALVVVMIAFAALFYFDVSKILHVKGVTRNGGDAAALAAARWQGISLNLIGSLNIAQANAVLDDLSRGNTTSPNAQLISDLQGRIAFSGPLHGYVSAQQVAKLNGLHNHSSLNDDLAEIANVTRTFFSRNYTEPFSPSSGFGNAWTEVADMYDLIIEQGMAVEATPQFIDYIDTNHFLLNPSFYDAVFQRNWCWFHWNAYTELQEYTDYTYWDELPERDVRSVYNSAVLSLHVNRIPLWVTVPALPPMTEDWDEVFSDVQDVMDTLDAEHPIFDENIRWTYYDSSRWRSWSTFLEASYDGAFPWDRDIRPEYDYMGADASMTVRAVSQRRSVFRRWKGTEEDGSAVREDHLVRYPSAKPFGSLESADGTVPPSTYGVLLPAFTDVRLIPRGASPSGHTVPSQPGWYTFIMFILPAYLEDGPPALSRSNYYARQLLTWERRSFREDGLEWLRENSDQCFQPSGGGGGGSGGGTNVGY